MLSSITWGQYFVMITLLLVCYYVYVGYSYFKWELLAMIGIKKVEPGATTIAVAELKKQFVSENHSDFLPKEITDIDLSPVTNAFKDEVKAFLQEAGSDTNRAFVLSDLQQICQKYPVLRDSDNSDELNLFLLTEVEKYRSELIDIEDIQHLWR